VSDFTYSLTTAIGQVRLLIPDNDAAAYELKDNEIQYFLDQVASNVNAAAVAACRMLARKFATKVSFDADGLRMDYSQRAAAFAARAEELAGAVGGGISTPTLTREDGYSEAAVSSDYASRIVYVRV
jgi:hypothetical protein